MKGFYRDFGKPFGFAAQPDASSLMVDLLTDPSALESEKHDPGIYDDDGNYIPMYSDDPSRVSAAIEANAGSAAPLGGAKGQSEDSADNSSNSVPASDDSSSD